MIQCIRARRLARAEMGSPTVQGPGPQAPARAPPLGVPFACQLGIRSFISTPDEGDLRSRLPGPKDLRASPPRPGSRDLSRARPVAGHVQWLTKRPPPALGNAPTWLEDMVTGCSIAPVTDHREHRHRALSRVARQHPSQRLPSPAVSSLARPRPFSSGRRQWIQRHNK